MARRWVWPFLILGAVLAAMQASARQEGRSRPTKASQRGTQGPSGTKFTSRQPAGLWLGQDGHDAVGPQTAIAPSDVQDIHIALAGLPRAEIEFAKVAPLGGGEWLYKGSYGPWAAQIERQSGSPNADLFIEPSQAETGRPFLVHLRFEGGRVAEFEVQGGRADPNLRMSGAAVKAEWLGQVREDRVGVTSAVGPDGLDDGKIGLSHLSKSVEITSVTISGTNGQGWQTGVNPKGTTSAELVRDGNDPSRAAVFLASDRDLKGRTLTIEVAYANNKVDSARVAGSFDPKKTAPRISPPAVETISVEAQWLGQDHTEMVGPGDVHVALSGLPSKPIAAASLSDSARGLWTVRLRDSVPFDAGEWSVPMSLVRGKDATTADLRFPPFRDETGGTMTLRIRFEDGKDAVATFAGGKADPAMRASYYPAQTSTTAHPGDDLNDLAARFGTIRLSAGRYEMTKPLVLKRPVTIAGGRDAILSFAQAAGDSPWSTAIKIHSGSTTLEGFCVRFSRPVRWMPNLPDGPAVIGATDSTDPAPGDLKAGLVFRSLDLEGPPPASDWEEAPRLLRMGASVCGVIEKNTLRGGTIDVNGGPWRIEGNSHVGTPPGTYAFSVISAHRTHDLIVRDNVARPSGAHGKTWRFLVMTGSGDGDLVENNTIEAIGPRDDDKNRPENAPEIILTEAYHLMFEGKPSSVAPDGRVLVLPYLHGARPQSGDVVSILSGPSAGQYRRVAQSMGPTTLLMDTPLPSGDYAVSISSGFVRPTFRGNRIDARGSSVAAGMVLVGNLYDLRVLDNHFLGAGEAFRITASPSETPVHWGWSHAPLIGATITGNTIEDSLRGGTLCVEHSPAIKTSRGRVYASAVVEGNTVVWTDGFVATLASRGVNRPAGLTLGDPASLEPSELVVTQDKNRSSGRFPISLSIPSALLDGKPVRNATIPLTRSSSAAGTKPGTRRN